MEIMHYVTSTKTLKQAKHNAQCLAIEIGKDSISNNYEMEPKGDR